MEALLDLQHVPAFRWLMSTEGGNVSKMMNFICGPTIAENHLVA